MWYVADLTLHYKLSQRGLNVSYNNNAVMMLVRWDDYKS